MTALRASWRTVRLSLVRETADAPFPQPGTLHTGRDAVGLVRALLRADPRESFVAIYLDNRHRPLAVHRVSVGTCDSAPVHPREVYCPAVALACAAVVVAHNHPSGDPTPSPEDRLVTERLRRAGEVLGIELLDHVVLGEARYFSFAEQVTRPLPEGGAA
jgi:DNA repair protein RadC